MIVQIQLVKLSAYLFKLITCAVMLCTHVLYTSAGPQIFDSEHLCESINSRLSSTICITVLIEFSLMYKRRNIFPFTHLIVSLRVHDVSNVASYFYYNYVFSS